MSNCSQLLNLPTASVPQRLPPAGHLALGKPEALPSENFLFILSVLLIKELCFLDLLHVMNWLLFQCLSLLKIQTSGHLSLIHVLQLNASFSVL